MEPKMTQSNNPLQQYFRQPAIYLRLPSQGRGWPPGSLDLPTNGELPVLPMTAVDEITYQTPDALFNGEAVVSVIQSCLPNIRDAWVVPGIDIDSILVAIRIASYGHSMDIGSKCPSCEAEHDFGLDLRTVIDGLRPADYSQGMALGDLKFYFRALDYREMTANAQIQFEQQKAMQIIGDDTLPDESRVQQINVMMQRIVELTVSTIAQSINEIRTNDAIITNQEHISEFLHNCDKDTFNRIRDHLLELKKNSEMQPLKIQCPSCQHQYEQAFTLDAARFFASAS